MIILLPPQDVKALYQALETKKSLGIVSEGGHNFTTERSRQELYNSIRIHNVGLGVEVKQ